MSETNAHAVFGGAARSALLLAPWPGPAIVHPSRLSILLVDDDVFVTRALERRLRNEHEVTIAKDGVEALRLLDRRQFDLILSDVTMPGMSGEELYRHVAALHPRMAERFVFLSGDPGAVGELSRPCIVKPFLPSEIERALSLASQAQWKPRGT